MSELKPLFSDRHKMALDVAEWFKEYPKVKQDSLGVICALSSMGYLSRSHITRADIPEALVREIKAEALENAAYKWSARRKRCFEYVTRELLHWAAKLREQKDD